MHDLMLLYHSITALNLQSVIKQLERSPCVTPASVDVVNSNVLNTVRLESCIAVAECLSNFFRFG